ncbi:MAG: efflux RND transporter periplasmic adaptor subunit [Candidatus Peribacteraceae bacterium]
MTFSIASITAPIRIALRFLRWHLKKTIAIVVVVIFAWISYAVTRPKQPVYITAVAQRGELKQIVEAVGNVISEKDLELQFPTTDVASQVYVKEGDKVKAGQRLAALRSGSLAASVASASASVQSALAQLKQLEEGSRPEDIAIAEAQVANKRASLEATKQTFANAEANLMTAQEQLEALRKEAAVNLAGQVGTAASSISQQLGIAKTALLSLQGVFSANDVSDAVTKSIPTGYDSLMANLQLVKSTVSLQQANPAPADYQSAIRALESARNAVAQTADILNRGYDTVAALPLTTDFSNTSRETNKTTIALQKSYVQTSLATLDTALKTLRDASATYDTKIVTQEASVASYQGTRDRAKADIATYETSLQIDEALLALKKAPPRQTDLSVARARVRQAQAELARAASTYNDTILTAPVDGTVTKVNVKVGEVRPTTQSSISMLGNTPYRIEMFVSEVDIPKVKPSQSGSIKLDAFPDRRFKLHVNEIDTAATDKDGVPKYRIKLDFVFPHDDLKVGMTGDTEIVTGLKADVVGVPLRSVLEKENGRKIVRILGKNGKSFTEQSVTTGMEGESGNVEVTGVKEGETVVVLIKL